MRLTTSEALSRVRPTGYEEMVYSTWLSRFTSYEHSNTCIYTTESSELDNEIYNLLS